MTAFAIFEKAQKNLAKNPNSEMDQFIVDLWNASKNLHSKNLLLESELAVAKHEVNEATRHNAVLAARIDVLESRAAPKLTYDNFMAGIIAGASAAS